MSRQTRFTFSNQFLVRLLDRFPNGILDYDFSFGGDVFLQTLNRQTDSVQHLYSDETEPMVDVDALPKLPVTAATTLKKSLGVIQLLGFELSSRLLEKQLRLRSTISTDAILQVYDQLVEAEIQQVSKEMLSC